MMNEPIQVDTGGPSQPDDRIQVDTAGVDVLPPEVNDVRAQKAHLGLGEVLSKTPDDFKDLFNAGKEKDIRQEAATQIDQNKAINRSNLISNILRQGGPATLARSIGQLPPTDPNSVIEEAFGRQYINPVVDLAQQWTGGTFMSQALKDIPGPTKDTIDRGATLVAKREFLQTMVDNEGEKLKHQPWLSQYGVGDLLKGAASFIKPSVAAPTITLLQKYLPQSWLGDQIKMAIPGVYDTELGSKHFRGLLGEDLEAQALEHFRKPLDQFKVDIPEIYNRIYADSPTMAYAWLNAMKGQSTDEKVVQDQFGVISAAPLLGPMYKGVVGLAGKLDLLNAVRRGVSNVVESSEVFTPEQSANLDKASELGAEVFVNGRRWTSPPNMKVVQEAAVGDLGSSAVTKTAQNLEEDIKGTSNPISRSIEPLLTYLRVDLEDIKNDPGRGGQDLVNRIEQSSNTFVEDMSNKIEGSLKVNRTPGELTVPVIEAQKDRIKGQFRGAANSVLDITGPHYDNITNTYFFEGKLGTFDGELFKSPKQAQLFGEFIGLRMRPYPVTGTPMLKLNQHPLEFQTYTAFRKAARAAGFNDKQIAKASGFKDSIAFHNAQEEAKRTDGYEVKQQGLGYYISVPKHLDETDSLLNTGLAETDYNKTKYTWANALIGYWRTPEDTLSPAESAQRKVATHTPSVLQEVAKHNFAEMNKVPRKYWADLDRVINHGRDLYDPITNQKGYFYRSPQDLEDWYQLFLGRHPEQSEIEAYFAFKRNTRYDLALRDILVYQHKARLSIDQHRFSIKDKDDNRKWSDWVDGREIDHLPGGEGSILIMGDKVGDEKVTNASGLLNSGAGERLRQEVLEGKKKVIELHAPEHRKLQGFTSKINDERVRWVVTNKLQTRPIQLGEQVPERGGGHFDVDFDQSIKQAIMRKDQSTGLDWYEGDRTITFGNNPGMLRNVVKHANHVQEFIAADMYDEARSYHGMHIPHLPDGGFEDFLKDYRATKDENGKRVGPRLNPHEPWEVVPKGRMIGSLDKRLEDRYGRNFRDGTKSGSLNRQFQVEYTGERDSHELFSVRDKGTLHNPLYAYEPAKMVDPIPTAGRALNRVIASQSGDSMKQMAMVHWLRDAEPYLDASKSEIWSAPWYYYNNVKWRAGATEVHGDKIRQLETTHFQQGQFSGAANKWKTFLQTADRKLAESVYDKFGPRASWVPDHLLSKLTDPFRFVRQIVVHSKLGMFNVPSFFVQGSTFSNVWAISGPMHAGPSMTATILHTIARINRDPAILDYLDLIASKMNHGPGVQKWRRGEWKEANSMINKESGFFNVGGEHGYVDDPLNTPTITTTVKGKVRTIADFGMSFFKEGAQSIRTAAWYAAYHEFRNGGGGSKPRAAPFTMGEPRFEGKPTGRITREEHADILDRAATLDHNMSRASNSTMQSGVWSIPMQFVSYRLRLTELMFSRRLTPIEKARLFGWSSFIYGLPFGGLGLVGVPVGDLVRRYAINHGYVVGNNFITSLLLEGGPAALIAYITGSLDDLPSAQKSTDIQDVASKGDWLNVGGRFGNAGLGDDVSTDKTLTDIIGGASLSEYTGLTEETYGIRKAMWAMIKGDPKSYPMTLEDILQAAKELNGPDRLFTTLTAIHTHEWQSKNGAYQSPVTTPMAIFQGLTGLSDQRSADAYMRNQIMRDNTALQNEGFNHFQENWHKSLEAHENNDPDSEKKFGVRARADLLASGWTEDKIPEAIRRATESYKISVIQRSNKRFFQDRPPAGKEAEFGQIYKEILKTEKKRGE